MVYCGKPSRGCETCRWKRRKCDQGRPGCGQCSRARFPCPGYRNELDLTFRDESKRIAGGYRVNVQARKGASTDSHAAPAGQIQLYRAVVQTSPSDIHHPHSDKKFQPPGSILQSLHQPIEEIAVNFFLSSYITDSHFEYLPTLFKVAITGGPLTACVRAVGLASISHDSGRLELMEAARCQYTHALSTTNKALQCPEKAVLDETLASVMLLALFEIVAHQVQESSDQWTSHVNGALALLVYRGPMQFKSAIGLLLFNQISSSIRVSCVQQKLRIPSDLVSLSVHASRYLDLANPVPRFSAIIEAFTDLRAAIQDGHITEPATVIRLARDVDDRALLLAFEMPAGWSYEVISSNSDDVAVFENVYHIYRDHRVAQMWNTIRMTRLLFNEMIHENLVKGSSGDDGWNTIIPDYSSLSDHYAQVARDMGADILASVPQFTRFSPGGSTLFTPTTASSCFLIWPLEVVASSRLSTAPMRAYAINRLRYMGSHMKVRQALEVAEKLEQGSVSQDWVHAYHLF